jgi:hypothetical protein
MAFKTADFKKTTRKTGDGRQIYPYQIRDDRYTAAIGYAIDYYERMVGRRQAEFEADTLLEFFGDPRLARGLVACLSRTYAWRNQIFAEAFGEPTAQALRRAGITTSAHLRARLYGLANGRYNGFILPHQRLEAVTFLCERISETAESAASAEQSSGTTRSITLTPEQFERALTLDAEDQRILIKLGPMPEPKEIVARYNYHSIETAICHAERLRLRLRGPIWPIVCSAHNLARRYKLRYDLGAAPRTLFDDHLDLTLHGGRDALGSWTRAGKRLARALLRLLAAHPNALVEGEALVHIGAAPALFRLDERALQVLGVGAEAIPLDGEAWEEDVAEMFRRAWARAFVGGRTAGWRLRRDPEPLIGSGAVVVPDFAIQRGNERLSLCLATNRTTADALVRDLARLGSRTPALAVIPAHVAETLRTCPTPLATYETQPSEAIKALALILERKYPRSYAPKLTPWQQLEQRVAEESFVGEEDVAALLSCPPEEALQLVRRWGGPSLHVLPGLGVCTPDAIGDIRQAIEESDLRQHAA